MSEKTITKITIKENNWNRSYFPSNKNYDYSIGTIDELMEELNKKSNAMIHAYNLVSLLKSTNDIDGSIENTLDANDVRYTVIGVEGKKVIYLFGITIYIYY